MVERVKQAVTATGDEVEVEFYTYPGAGHAFDNPHPMFFNEPASELARQRTLAFLKQHLH